MSLASDPSLIEYKNLKFLITEAPKENNLPVFLKLFKKFNVTQLVKISETRYNQEMFEEAGIKFHVINVNLDLLY
jgi:protein tyrosine phosphatase type 4A